VVLGALYKLFLKKPLLTLDICTFPDYATVLNLVFPLNVTATTVNFRNDKYIRHEFGLRAKPGIDEMPAEVSECLASSGHSLNARKIVEELPPDLPSTSPPMYYLNQPIRYGASPGFRYCCIFPRKRAHQPFRNSKFEDLAGMAAHLGYDTVVVPGLDFEVDTYRQGRLKVVKTNSILEDIAYLNHADLLISPWSGMAQFAINCGCRKVVYISTGLPSNVRRHIEGNHFPFNPFGAMREMA
jgi:hypothetical protein